MALLLANTAQGTVEGLPAGNNRISVFKDIPFAAPPVGDLRWKAPMPPSNWTGVRKAYTYSKIPVQPLRPKGSFYQKLYFPVDLPQSEDCLYINIWTPAEAPSDNIPVAVWIYGGAFVTGYAQKIEFDGEAFAKRGCIFVSFNYRLGIMGFLAHPELSAESGIGQSGNYALMDQIAALRWVQENIAAFGGDPNNVTIFGQSAGAISCMSLCCSPKTEGLFHRAIMESCGGSNIEVERQTLTLSQAEQLGVSALSDMGYTSICDARSADAQEILQRLANAESIPPQAFMPIIDGGILPTSIFKALKENRQKRIDYMCGSVANEGYGFHLGTKYSPEGYCREAEYLYHNRAKDFLKAVGFDPNSPEAPADNFGDNMLAACLFWNEFSLSRGNTATYQYYFTKTLPGEPSGAFHSAEHAYIFRTLDRFDLPYQGSDYELSRQMCDYWCNFIRSGDPNGDGLIRWRKYQSGPQKILELGDCIQMIDIPDRPGAKFSLEYLLQSENL